MALIMVTGSAGFIGFHVSRRLLSHNHSVIGIDNFNSYYAPVLKRARADLLCNFSRFIPLELNFCQRNAIEKCFREYQPEVVCHLGAQAGVRYSLTNPFSYVDSNLAGFVNIIEQTRRLAAGTRFVYASSSSVYGGNTKMPYAESDPVNTPISLYAATKRANEMIAFTYHHLYGLQTMMSVVNSGHQIVQATACCSWNSLSKAAGDK